MKGLMATILMMVGAGVCVSLAWSNPAMLPKHPGYPAGRDLSPVTGQPLANDPGQLNLTVEQSTIGGAAAEDAHVVQRLRDSENERIIEKPGAGVLPRVEGPQIAVDPPVKEGTSVPQSRGPMEGR